MTDSPTITRLKSALPGEIAASFEWKWDERFMALVSEFEIEQLEDIDNSLSEQFSQCWDQITIQSAPDKTLEDAKDFAELREGQKLYIYSIDNTPDSPVMAAIWPWGDGKTVSLRIKAPQ